MSHMLGHPIMTLELLPEREATRFKQIVPSEIVKRLEGISQHHRRSRSP